MLIFSGVEYICISVVWETKSSESSCIMPIMHIKTKFLSLDNPIGSMYGIFTYIWLKFIYHTWILWEVGELVNSKLSIQEKKKKHLNNTLIHSPTKWVFPEIVVFPPKSSHFNRVFHYKPSILGVKSPYFWFNTHILNLPLNSPERSIVVREALPKFTGSKFNSADGVWWPISERFPRKNHLYLPEN